MRMEECLIWSVPLGDDCFLIYAPYHNGITTLVNYASLECARRCLSDPDAVIPDEMDWIRDLRGPADRPGRKQGRPDPLYLGIIPTRACTMQCAYCDFASDRVYPLMPPDMIRQAVDGYARLLRQNGAAEWHTHFFGGEPFAAFKELVFAVNYARRKAGELGLPTHFEVTTNGFYPEEKCRWIAENFDTVVLSFDGFPDAQNRHRPAPGGKDSFMTVCRNADIFARSDCELIIRSCVSAENVEDLPRWASFIAERFFPAAAVLEPMIESPLSRRNGLTPPDPDLYAKMWITAYRVLKNQRIPLICSSGEVNSLKSSLCPMGQDALIVAPDGSVGGCWQLAEHLQEAGVDLRFGQVSGDGIRIDADALEYQRDLSEANRERCRNCFCYAHCAGGCLLNREKNETFCRMTRVLTLWQLFEKIDYHFFMDELLMDRDYINWLAGKKDFSLFAPDDFPSLDHEPDPDGAPCYPDVLEFDFSDLVLPPFPAAQRTGRLRDGSRYLAADLSGISLKTMEGDEALRFQLEHSGLSKAEIEIVRSALREEAD